MQIAIELETIPLMIVRRVPWDVYQNLKRYGVLTKIYETAIMPESYGAVVADCKSVLGMPLIALDSITSGTRQHLATKVIQYGFDNVDELKKSNLEYLGVVKRYREKLRALDKELRFI